MKQEVEIAIREAIPQDAKQVLELFNQVRTESDFLLIDETILQVSVEKQEQQLANLYQSPKNVLMVVFDGEKMIGFASIRTEAPKRIAHIGDVGIAILKEYWDSGLGGILLDEVIDWAYECGEIHRLQLTVQNRNERAIHLYTKKGFLTECVMRRGAISDSGELLDVRLMSKLID